MSKKAIIFLSIAIGTALGAALTRRYFKQKYEQLAQEEIDSVKEVFAKRQTADSFAREKANQAKKKPDVTQYTAILAQQGYVNYSDHKKEDSEPMIKPYVISPEEFGEIEEYEKISLIYYADQVLADENDEKILEVNSLVGADSLTRFGEYEEDSVFVRNVRLKCDLEILLDHRKYSEVTKDKARGGSD